MNICDTRPNGALTHSVNFPRWPQEDQDAPTVECLTSPDRLFMAPKSLTTEAALAAGSPTEGNFLERNFWKYAFGILFVF